MHHHTRALCVPLIPLFKFRANQEHIQHQKNDFLLKALIHLLSVLESFYFDFTHAFKNLQSPFTNSKLLSLHLTLQDFNNDHQVIFFLTENSERLFVIYNCFINEVIIKNIVSRHIGGLSTSTDFFFR